MAKTANDPYFGFNIDASSPPRHGAVVTPSDTVDLVQVTKKLIVNIGVGATGMAVLFPEDLDSAPLTIPLGPAPASGLSTIILDLQVRRIMATGTALGTNGSVIACWGG